jgi:hypothetical protein
MDRPTIGTSGGNPTNDGDIHLYISPEAEAKSWFNRSRRVMFVNGMMNSPADHASSARALSLLQACPVVGVFNKSDGLWPDLGQCIMDKATLVGVQAEVGTDFRGWLTAVNGAFELARRLAPTLTKVDFIGSLIASNAATFAVYRYVVTLGGAERAALKIYCHSQGNLVTSNALTAVALALGEDSLGGIEVNGFGSPCRYWPPKITRTNYAFTFDPVSWLDYRVSFDNVKVGFIAGHAFTLYMQNDGEFVVNRFRWGSFGMTVNMDEAGLAGYCISIGNNPPRLRGIFNRLKEAHWTDSDDVAYEYVPRIRTRNLVLLQSIARTDAGFIRLLIELLGAGWVSADEQRQIDFLKTLI